MTLIAITLSFSTRAENDSFSYNSEEVNTHLGPLLKLEQLHKKFPDKTLEELITDNELSNYSFTNASKLQNGISEPMPILPAFWWGCLLGWVGILVVFLVTQDSLQTQNALWGCIVSALFSCTLYAIIVLSVGLSSDFFFWFW